MPTFFGLIISFIHHWYEMTTLYYESLQELPNSKIDISANMPMFIILHGPMSFIAFSNGFFLSYNPYICSTLLFRHWFSFIYMSSSLLFSKLCSRYLMQTRIFLFCYHLMKGRARTCPLHSFNFFDKISWTILFKSAEQFWIDV